MDLTLIRSLIKAVQEAFDDPDVQKDYERWMTNAKEEQQDSGKQV